jgi:hypothetical protein
MRNLRQQVEQPQENDTTTLTYIYGLVDPLTGFVRYVGKAHDPIYRLRVHLTPRELRGKTHKNHWIRGLLDIGEKPEQIILEKVNRSEWQQAERKWIAYYRSIPGYPSLTNGTSGGDGVDKGTKPSEETRKKLSAARRGKKLPPFTEEHRRNLSDATKKTWENLSDEDRAKVIARLTTSEWTEERRTNIGLILRGNKRTSSTSKFIGIYREGKYWHVYMSVKGSSTYGGRFLDETQAARARDVLAIKILGPTTKTNFPFSDYSIDELSREVVKFGPSITNTSGYKGVYWSKLASKWIGAGRLNGKQMHLGCFAATEHGKLEAAHAYDRWVIQYRGPDAYTNFPRAQYA